jgi:hypothetical protein
MVADSDDQRHKPVGMVHKPGRLRGWTRELAWDLLYHQFRERPGNQLFGMAGEEDYSDSLPVATMGRGTDPGGGVSLVCRRRGFECGMRNAECGDDERSTIN